MYFIIAFKIFIVIFNSIIYHINITAIVEILQLPVTSLRTSDAEKDISSRAEFVF